MLVRKQPSSTSYTLARWPGFTLLLTGHSVSTRSGPRRESTSYVIGWAARDGSTLGRAAAMGTTRWQQPQESCCDDVERTRRTTKHSKGPSVGSEAFQQRLTSSILARGHNVAMAPGCAVYRRYSCCGGHCTCCGGHYTCCGEHCSPSQTLQQYLRRQISCTESWNACGGLIFVRLPKKQISTAPDSERSPRRVWYQQSERRQQVQGSVTLSAFPSYTIARAAKTAYEMRSQVNFRNGLSPAVQKS